MRDFSLEACQTCHIVLQTAVRHYETEYIMRADDDSYLNIPVIMHMLQQQRAEGPGRAFWRAPACVFSVIPNMAP